MVTKVSYFENNGVTPKFYRNYQIPYYLLKRLPKDKKARILDIGCGHGQLLLALKKLGHENVEGLDILPEAVRYCREQGLDVHQTDGTFQELLSQGKNYDLITMSHVLEHLPKEKVINRLQLVKALLNPSGSFLVMVPNGQSLTGCYWAYQDFTHYTLFTAGSLLYVLREAGFNSPQIIDPYSIEGVSLLKRVIRKIFWHYYDSKIRLLGKIMDAPFHAPAPRVYSFEVKGHATK